MAVLPVSGPAPPIISSLAPDPAVPEPPPQPEKQDSVISAPKTIAISLFVFIMFYLPFMKYINIY